MTLDTLYIPSDIHFFGDNMKEDKKKKILCGAAILILLSTVVLPLTTAQYVNTTNFRKLFDRNVSVGKNDEKKY